jgi:hypothetical protein
VRHAEAVRQAIRRIEVVPLEQLTATGSKCRPAVPDTFQPSRGIGNNRDWRLS